MASYPFVSRCHQRTNDLGERCDRHDGVWSGVNATVCVDQMDTLGQHLVIEGTEHFIAEFMGEPHDIEVLTDVERADQRGASASKSSVIVVEQDRSHGHRRQSVITGSTQLP